MINIKLISFNSYASLVAILAGLSWLSYAYFFVVVRDPFSYSLSLLLAGLFSLKVAVALFAKLEGVEKNFARIALILGVIGSSGVMIHGGYDLANAINPPALNNPDLPNQVDPRGLLAFFVSGLAVLKFGWLMTSSSYFPKNLGYLGMLSGVLLLVIYWGRLVILDPTNPILLYPVLIEGFIVAPLWYLWVGMALKKK